MLPVLAGAFDYLTFSVITPHKLLISGNADQVNSALDLIKKIDGSNYQVKVEAIIASLTESEFYELGLRLTSGTGSPSYNVILNSAFDALMVANTGLLIDYFSDILGVNFSAIENNSHGEILSSPVLTVLNGQTARLHVGQNVPFLSKARVETESGTQEGIDIERHDVGLTFEVTPSVDPAGEFIHLSVNQIVSAIQPDTQNTQASDIITDKKELQTTVMVADGDTIFIGGMKSDESGYYIDKVPFLGSLPLFGQLFTYKSNQNVTRHLIISLRVNVIHRS
ncbi:MAG: hypothetical protein SCH71_06500 [Desulfobulbaceae bacterium]|nr:hypothetical protein [Desulfobulbaceae bacterium]